MASGLALTLAGCAARSAEPVGAPVADPAARAAQVARFEAETGPATPRRAAFTWTLEEAGSRVGGSGVVRFVAPERLRLDLFGPRGETYLAAALVGEEFRLPPAAARGVDLPSPALLWAALGVFSAPPGSSLASATAADSAAGLEYRSGEERYDFRGRETERGLRLTQVERIGPSGVLESVRLEYGPDGMLRRTRYRDWSAYRDLVFELEDVDDVEPFPEGIWSPGSGR